MNLENKNLDTKSNKYYIEIEGYLAEVHAKADKIIDRFILGFFIFGLLLAPIYDTWTFSLATGSLTVLMYAMARFVVKNKFHARMIISLVFSIFMLQYIGQMHGMAELHFLFFTNITILIIYQDWRVIAPYTLAAVVHHSVLAFFQWYFGDIGNLGQYFISYSAISFLQLGFHFGLVGFMGVICGWWAIILRNNSITILKSQLLAQEQTEIALSSEEEIRQNLEELHTIQEKLIATQEEERKSNEVFKALFEYSTNPHLLFDKRGIIDCNNATLNILGYSSKNELLKIHPAKLSPEKQKDGQLSSEKAMEMDKIAREQGYHRFEWTHRKIDNTDFPVEVTINPIKLDDKEVLLVVWNDLTERKQAEKEITNQNERLLLKNKEIAESHQKLIASGEEIRQNMEELVSTQEQLQAQYNLLNIKNKNISDSINYAKRIQNALLPRLAEIQQIFPESFILFRPKDVISGDFYWFANKTDHNLQILVAADCTGHGVPGAFMSMLGSSLLSNIIHDREIHEPNKILDLLHSSVEEMLNQRKSDNTNRDGMDATICVIDRNQNQIHYAGANNSLYVISQNSLSFTFGGNENTKQIVVTEAKNWILTELKADKKPIGGRASKQNDLAYNFQTFGLNQELRLYLSSDGFIDQIGGENRKKLMSKNFKQLLIENHEKPYQAQRDIFNDFFENWISYFDNRQLDDVMLLGVKVTNS